MRGGDRLAHHDKPLMRSTWAAVVHWARHGTQFRPAQSSTRSKFSPRPAPWPTAGTWCRVDTRRFLGSPGAGLAGGADELAVRLVIPNEGGEVGEHGGRLLALRQPGTRSPWGCTIQVAASASRRVRRLLAYRDFRCLGLQVRPARRCRPSRSSWWPSCRE